MKMCIIFQKFFPEWSVFLITFYRLAFDRLLNPKTSKLLFPSSENTPSTCFNAQTRNNNIKMVLYQIRLF